MANYAWALHIDEPRYDVDDDCLLDPAVTDVERGLACAYVLAVNRDARRRTFDDRPPRLTVRALARRLYVPEASVRRWIRAAYGHYVGSISERGERARRRRQRLRSERDGRPCQQPGCANEIPGAAHGNRDYCDEHT